MDRRGVSGGDRVGVWRAGPAGLSRADGGEGRSAERDRAEFLDVQRCACRGPGDRRVYGCVGGRGLVFFPERIEFRGGHLCGATYAYLAPGKQAEYGITAQ